jgi:predicted RNA-binding protein YlxR (DUF448 family)
MTGRSQTIKKGHVPIRTCIACGEKAAKEKLLRLVLDNRGNVLPDPKGNRPGRGGYICNTQACRNRLSKHKALNRVFRTEKQVRFSPGTVPDHHEKNEDLNHCPNQGHVHIDNKSRGGGLNG